MTRARWKAVGMLAGMFLLGGVAGAGVMRAVDDREMTEALDAPPAEARLNFRLRAMARQLGLSREQRQQAAAIVRKYREQCGAVDRKVEEQRAACRSRAQDELLELLTPQQRRQHQRLQERRQNRHRYRGGRGPQG